MSDYHLWLQGVSGDRDQHHLKIVARRERDVRHLMYVNVHGPFVQDCLSWLCPHHRFPHPDTDTISASDCLPWALVVIIIIVIGESRTLILGQEGKDSSVRREATDTSRTESYIGRDCS